jgi:poly-beta-hydroxyalkanoate depolymerase
VINAQLEQSMITQINGNRFIPAKSLTSFLTVDFFDHESKNTDPPAEGYEPFYDTLIAFKNLADNFYIRHLEREFIHVEVYMLESRP